MDIGEKSTEIANLSPARSLQPLQKLAKEIKGGKDVRRKTITKPPTVATRVLADRAKKDFPDNRKSRAHSVRKSAAKRKVKKTSARKVLKTILRVGSNRLYRTFDITSKQAKERLGWGKMQKNPLRAGV